jgi:hypothetical protein
LGYSALWEDILEGVRGSIERAQSQDHDDYYFDKELAEVVYWPLLSAAREIREIKEGADKSVALQELKDVLISFFEAVIRRVYTSQSILGLGNIFGRPADESFDRVWCSVLEHVQTMLANDTMRALPYHNLVQLGILFGLGALEPRVRLSASVDNRARLVKRAEIWIIDNINMDIGGFWADMGHGEVVSKILSEHSTSLPASDALQARLEATADYQRDNTKAVKWAEDLLVPVVHKNIRLVLRSILLWRQSNCPISILGRDEITAILRFFPLRG